MYSLNKIKLKIDNELLLHFSGHFFIFFLIYILFERLVILLWPGALCVDCI